MKHTIASLAEQVAYLTDMVKQQDRVIANIVARTATKAQTRAAFAAVNDVRRAAMAAAKAEALRTGHSVRVAT